MTGVESGFTDILRLAAVFILVLANGFFVAAEFSLVAIRRSRVAELVTEKRPNAFKLQNAIDHLDGNLAATQLGITISSLALGWIGEPALAHLIEPLIQALPGNLATIGSHALAVAISFIIITMLHIVLGELAPKSLALQRSEATALAVVRLLGIFRALFRPAIYVLNGLGNQTLKLAGLQAGEGESSTYSSEELKLMVAASRQAGVLQQAQLEMVERVINLSNRCIGDFMTPRFDVEWVDADGTSDEILETIRESRHAQVVVSRGELDEVVGLLLKEDLIACALDNNPIDITRLVRPTLVVHEATPFLRVLDQFKKQPVRLAIVVDEYGGLEGIVTQTDILEAMAGAIPGSDNDPSLVTRADGSLLIDGMMPAHEVWERLGIRDLTQGSDFHTIAGFVLQELGHIPHEGEMIEWQGWRFEVIDMDGRRVDKLLVKQIGIPEFY